MKHSPSVPPLAAVGASTRRRPLAKPLQRGDKRADASLQRAQLALERAGVRVTYPRLLVLSVFQGGMREAMPADRVLKTLFERGDMLSLSSVYGALRQLDEARLIVGHFEDGRRVYEEAGALPSARVVCDVCGTERTLCDARLDAVVRQVASEAGFELGDYRLLVSAAGGGGCPACGKRGRFDYLSDT